ncbi:MAG: methionyl-tRNA formyltransferase [Eubacterium sp.]|nr:methionyl-tRNA formyltransferase [Eubacterium sp.]
MRVVFMGTPDFSVPALERIASEHEVVAVVTQKDKPKGRGQELAFTPVKESALKLNIPVLQPEKVKEESFVKELKDLNPDAIVVIAFGQILSNDILTLPKYGCINVHASLLPKYRGAAPIQWAVIDGEEKSGVCTMKMDEGLDTGDIIDVDEITLDPKETGGSLFDKLSKLGGELILKTLQNLEFGKATFIKQDDSKSTYAKKMTKDLGHIDFTKDAVSIERLIRGLNPWPSAFTYLDGKVMKIWDADVVEETGEPGTVINEDKDSFVIATGDKALKVNELQLEGKKRMKASDFLNGRSIEGSKLG